MRTRLASRPSRCRAITRRRRVGGWKEDVGHFAKTSHAAPIVALVLIAASAGLRHDYPKTDKNEVPGSIASDCSRAVDVRLNRILASAADGSTVNLRKGGCYGIDRSLVLAGKSNVTLDGAGAHGQDPHSRGRAAGQRRRPAGEQRVGGQYQGGRGVPRPRRRRTARQRPPQRQRDGNAARDLPPIRSPCHRPKLRSVNTGGECVMVMSDFDPMQGFVGEPSSDVLIEGVDCRHTGRQGVGIADGERVVLRGSTISDAHDCANDIEADIESQVARDITIVGNTFGTSRFADVCNGGQGFSPNVGNVTVERNTMTVPPSSCFGPVYIETPAHSQAENRTRTGYKFIGNKFLSISYSFVLIGVTDVEISGSVIQGGLPGTQGCVDATRSPPELQPAVDARNLHRLYGTDNVWVGYQRVVRADHDRLAGDPTEQSEPILLGPHPALREFGEPLRISLAGDQRLHHGQRRLRPGPRRHRSQLDPGLLEQLSRAAGSP